MTRGAHKNPIYIAYYPHTRCDCYKINLPFTTFGRETIVLCEVKEGLEEARTLARKVLTEHIMDALDVELINKEGVRDDS